MSKLLGIHTTAQAEGAIPNGTRVVKRNSEPGDGRPDGQLGTVRGSLGGPAVEAIPIPHRPGFRARHLYFVEWDTAPGLAIAVVDDKITKAS